MKKPSGPSIIMDDTIIPAIAKITDITRIGVPDIDFVTRFNSGMSLIIRNFIDWFAILPNSLPDQ